MNIYVASSYRNTLQPKVVEALRALGHEVYDFKSPPDFQGGKQWSAIDPAWQQWTPRQFRDALADPRARRSYEHDKAALERAHAVVLVLPAGDSAHSEAGWAAGRGKRVVVLVPEDGFAAHYDARATATAVAPKRFEPELMYRMFDRLVVDLAELAAEFAPGPGRCGVCGAALVEGYLCPSHGWQPADGTPRP